MKKICLKYSRIINALILSLLPITVCLLRALVARQSLFDVWFCGSNWPDELFYYQMTSGVVHHGIPQGYFGYNEGTAQFLSFGTWNPLLLLFWSLYGAVFGWNILSPVICNIVLMTVALFLFAFFAKPGFAKTIILFALLFVLTPISRFLMSCMPEISVLAIVTVMLGLWYRANEGYRPSYMVISYVLLFISVLMRPYLLLFVIIPAVREFKQRKLKITVPMAVAFLSLSAYGITTKLFSSPYFYNAISLDWITGFFAYGPKRGFEIFKNTFMAKGSDIVGRIWPGLRYGEAGNAYYGVFVAFMIIFIVIGIKDLIMKRKNALFTFSYALILIGMLFALTMMYTLNEGARHLLIFIAAGCMILSVRDFDKTDIAVPVGCFLIFSWVFIYKGTDNYYYHVSFKDEGAEYVEDIALQAKDGMALSKGLSWDNTVIWVSLDYIPESDEYAETVWRMLYGLPEGYGLNICSADYVKDNIDDLKSRYIATVPGGTVEKELLGKDPELIAENEFFVLYRIRN